MTDGRKLIGALLLVCTSVAVAEPSASQSAGLTVTNGVLMKAGKPYTGIGLNYFGLFKRMVQDRRDDTHKKELQELSSAGVPFIRFMAGGYWPSEYDLYFRDENAYWERMDDLVRAAEKAQMGLVPSLFWHYATVPDLVGEPMDQWGNVESKTVRFMKDYTGKIVLRYRRSPAIWGWEFGNEVINSCDLPNASEWRPPVHPSLKTALKRTERDEITSAMILTAYSEFAKTVRKLDPHRIIISGNSIPAFCAYHTTHFRSWDRDTRDQFRQILLRDNPDPMDTICIHLYPKTMKPYFKEEAGWTDVLALVQQFSKTASKPLFVGEFGVPSSSGSQDFQTQFHEITSTLVDMRIPLAAAWSLDAFNEKNWNAPFEEVRTYMIKRVARANRDLALKQPGQTDIEQDKSSVRAGARR